MQSPELIPKQQQNPFKANIEKAKKMSIDEIQRKQNRSQSIENILSSSIARAKQKIQMMEQKKNPKETNPLSVNRSLQKKQNKDIINLGKAISQSNNQEVQTTRSKQPFNKLELKQNNSAVINVVKSLQTKINDLQKTNESIERQKLIITKQLENVAEQKRLLLQNMEQVKRKNLHLEQTIIKSIKQELKQLQQKFQLCEGENIQLKSKIKQLELKLKQQHQNHLSIQKNNEKKLKQKKDEETNSKKYQSLYQSKIKETEQHERNLLVKEKDLNQKQSKLQMKFKEIFEKEDELLKKQGLIKEKQAKNYGELVRHNQTMNLANEIRKDLEEKNNQLKRSLEEYKAKCKEMEKMLEGKSQELEGEKHKNQQLEFNFGHMYKDKIEELQDQIIHLKTTHKHNSKSKLSVLNQNDKIDALNDQVSDLMQQYEEVLSKLGKTQDKLQKQQKQAKNYRSKFWKLKQIVGEISQKVSKMPNAIHSQLKLLIVKANKLESYQIEKATLSNIYGTPNKKNRSNSIQNKSNLKLSKQKPKSKQKNINLTYLDSSRKSNTSAKSKRSQKSDRSNSKKKQVILSTTNKAAMNQNQNKIGLLQRQVQTLKNTYKKLVEVMNQRNDQQTRNQLNNLVFELQQKSEELTKLKKQRKKKF